MDKFVIRTNISLVQESNKSARKVEDDGQKIEQVELSSLIADPGLRISISQYHPNIRDQVRRAYLQKGPCQPNNHNFKKRKIGDLIRRFRPTWYGDHESWLEYSVEKEAVFCLCCYLFKNDVGRQGSGDSFVKEGFDGWNKKDSVGP
ncbi:putative transcription factor and/or regulators TTF-type(Zn) family [Heracleum sosnowskyi]|uniref:Transcription factor and/or regulators TTF-type(Zn) family n=1 Tax=Heracleum sosnowskyi TaxID=360622 RepID=A0AAD8I6M9_9APIA|nr:putative transcription factor and/or regulators TTF-type(Zn) family [Heracleum sosnowskyi]